MQYVNLGKTGLKVSRLCLGTMTFGSPQWRPWVLDEAASSPILKAALERGINFFDMADFYSLGVGEEVVGRTLLKHAPREELVLASKAFYAMGSGPNAKGLSRKHLLDAIDASLKRIGTDYLDLYIIHGFDRETPIEETLETLNDIVRSGRVRYIGASTMYAWEFVKMLYTSRLHGWSEFVSMQCQLNAAYREEERETIPFCRDQGLAVTPFSPLARGLLSGNLDSLRNQTDSFTTDMYGDETSHNIARAVKQVAKARGLEPAQVALNWVINRPGVTSTLFAVENIAQLDEQLAALELKLSPQELQEIDRWYTPCDVINDYNSSRIPRTPRQFVKK
ncbi:MAG: aldo/keto reductase [Thermaceae bacterium]|nr:aldo/keto reductase [Thermaceae bacterium]